MIVAEKYVPTRKQIDAVLAFLPVFERPGFVPSKMEFPPGQLPYHVLSEELERFQRAVYDGGFIFDFDWPEWQTEAQRYLEHPERLQTASLQVLRKLLTVHLRKERFCEGHLPAMVGNGHIAAVLRRLKELREGPSP